VIELPGDGVDGQVWRLVCRMANEFKGSWALIGARMVELHGLAAGRTAPRRSADVDALCEAKAIGSRPRDLVAWLSARGFESDGVSPDGIGHRYRLEDVFIDVLAPDRLGARASLDVDDGIRTVAVPGGRRALNHLGFLAARCADQLASIPVPDLGGALVIKSQAVEVDDVPDNQRVDLAFLYSLVDDPRALGEGLTASDIAVLRRRRELASAGHSAWRALGGGAVDAHLAFGYLTRSTAPK